MQRKDAETEIRSETPVSPTMAGVAAKPFAFDSKEIEDLKTEVTGLIGPDKRKLPKSNSAQAAEWRLRCKRSRAIYDKLNQLGKLAILSSGGLLLSLSSTNEVLSLDRRSNWKATMIGSAMFTKQDHHGQQCLLAAEYEQYTRIEKGISAFGQMVCLAVDDINEPSLLKSFDRLKTWCVSHAFVSEKTNDEVLKYLKFLCKVAQSWLLKSPMPDEPSAKPEHGGVLDPFVGELGYLSKAYFSKKRRKEGMTLKMARQLAQLANTSRALPYPSRLQIIDSIKETIEIFQTEHLVDKIVIEDYERSLRSIVDRLKPTDNRSHCSLVGSGSFENPRSKGGKARFLTGHAKMTTNIKFDPDCKEQEGLIGKYDQFGQIILYPDSYTRACLLLSTEEYKRPPTLGELLYVKESELPELWFNSLNGDKRLVPRYLGSIINATASKLMLKVGNYQPAEEIVCDYLTFSSQEVTYTLTGVIQVKADVSIEAGMKTRLITASLVGFSHLSQLPANLMRGWLSQDEFIRTGFLESDKLWSELKRYQKDAENQA
jgi:hypothetical protein